MEHGLADLVLDLAFFDFVWGPQPSSDQLADIWALAPIITSGSREPDIGRTGNANDASAESIAIEAWLNFASNTKPSSYGSTCGRTRS